MSDENKNKGVEMFDDSDIGPTKDEKTQARLEHLLGNVERGWKISILRVDPSWCRGHLETKEIYDASDQIDIGYLIDNWGGHRLHVKIHDESSRWLGGGSVSLYSYPPKREGVLLKRTDHYLPAQNELQGSPPLHYQQPPAQNPAPQLDIRALLDIVAKQKGTDIGGLLKVLEFAQGRQQPPAQNSSITEQMLGMLSLFREMQSVFGGMGGNGKDSDDDSFTPVIAEVVKGLVANQSAPPPSRGALSPPQRRPARVSRNVRPPNVTDRDDDEVEPAEQTPQSIQDFANKLATLDPDDAVGVVMMAMDKMPPDKAQTAMTSFLSGMSGDDNLDDSLNPEHNDRQETDHEDPYSDDQEG